MKLLCLNIWGGKTGEKLLEFIEKNSKDTDIFCFQEMFTSDRETLTPNGSKANILDDIKNVLNDFNYYFSPTYHNRDFQDVVSYPLSQGPATFWKKSLHLKEKGEIFTHNSENDVRFFEPDHIPNPPRNFQYFIFDKFLVINVHGFWNPAPKTDTPERLKQSQMILDFVKKYDTKKIICGDFNLRIDSKSLKMFEDNGFINLVKESNYQTTRSTLYDIKWRLNDLFADYMIVSKNIKVNDFKVLEDEVSDHLTLTLNFEA